MNIQTMSTKLKKPKKQDIQKTIELLYEASTDKEDRVIYAEMYKYFIPTASKIAKTPQEWVNKAVSKDKARYYICNSYSDGEFLIATDANRLHYIPSGLSESYRDRNGVALDIDGAFPDWKRIIPKTDIDMYLNVAELKIDKLFDFICYVIELKIDDYEVPFELFFKTKFIDEALNGQKDFKLSLDSKNLIHDGWTSVLLDLDNNRKAVVMPLNLKAKDRK